MSTRLRVHSPAVVYFDAVRRAGSIREAARRLFVASSAVNRQILKLEDEVGTPLFERLPGGLRLTTAGEIFARHALVVLQDAERARSELDALKGLRTGHVEIATVEGVTSDFMPTIIERAREHFPKVTLGVVTLGSRDIPEAVTSGAADLGMAFTLQRSTGLRQIMVGRFRLGALVPAEHPLAKRHEVSFATCAEYPLILAKTDLSVYHLLKPAIAPASATRAWCSPTRWNWARSWRDAVSVSPSRPVSGWKRNWPPARFDIFLSMTMARFSVTSVSMPVPAVPCQ